MFDKKYKKILPKILIIVVMIVGGVLALVLLQGDTSIFLRAFGRRADIRVNMSGGVSGTNSWKNLSQGGEEPVSMIASVVEPVRELSPRYIRVDHIYDFYNVVSRDLNGQLIFDWTNLDKVVDDIVKTGARPFLSLSYMPAALTSGTEVDYPVNWQEWELLVQKTIERYSGDKNIDRVYYEVWNEPDLFGSFKLYGDKNYLTLYLHSSNGAARAQNVRPFRFGGPATTALYKNWVVDFISFVSKNNLRLDFYSWHRYSKNVDDYKTDIADIHNYLRRTPGYEGIELVISEMGYSSEIDSAYDTTLGAIHTLAAISQIEGEVDKAFSFEVKDGPGDNQFWGRWGILTHEKHGPPVKKPRFYALEFLNNMDGGFRLQVTGQGTWVKAMASATDGKYKLLVVNYDPSGKNYETVPLSFYNLRSAVFTFRRVDFLGETTERQISNNSTLWQTSELMAPNTAAIFEIEY